MKKSPFNFLGLVAVILFLVVLFFLTRVSVEENIKSCDLSIYNPLDVYNTTSTGASMLPAISNPANISAIKIHVKEDIKIGDIVMVELPDKFIQHRLIAFNDTVYETRGDYCDGYSKENPDGSVTYVTPVCTKEFWTFNQIRYKTVCVNGVAI